MQEKVSSGSVVPCEVIIFTHLHSIEMEGYKLLGDCVPVDVDSLQASLEFLLGLYRRARGRFPEFHPTRSRPTGKLRYQELHTVLAKSAADGGLSTNCTSWDYYFTDKFAPLALERISRLEPSCIVPLREVTQFAAVRHWEDLLADKETRARLAPLQPRKKPRKAGPTSLLRL